MYDTRHIPAEITIPPSSVPGPNSNLSLNPYPNPNNTNRNSVPYYAVHKFYYVLLRHNGSKTYSSIHTYRGGSVAEWLYDTRCYFNVRSKADISQLNLPHGVVSVLDSGAEDPGSIRSRDAVG